MASDWISYNELAWTEDFLTNPEDQEAEVNEYIKWIQQASKEPVQTILHLGCGAGGHDLYLKKHFAITGVDISKGMIIKAKTKNPEITYHEGDMRSIRLNRTFDCVVIPDSIDYMTTLDDLKLALQTSAIHLRPGGILLIVGKTKETFQNNNFVYSGQTDDTHVTVYENNYINPYLPDKYEITLLYLIRKKGKLQKYIETSLAGLFPETDWDEAFTNAGFMMEKRNLDGLYDKYLLESGTYPLTVFIGIKL